MACVALTLPNVKFHFIEPIMLKRVMRNHLDSNSFTDDIVQFKLIPPYIPIVLVIICTTLRQTQLEYTIET